MAQGRQVKPYERGNVRTESYGEFKVKERAINFTVPGDVPALLQPDTNLCWATAGAILASWRDQVRHEVADFAHQLGSPFSELFDTNTALDGGNQPAFAAAVGLTTEPPASYPIDTLLGLMQAHGPLWTITAVDVGKPFSAHARILTGIFGDGTNDGTDLIMLDPGSGMGNRQSVTDFLALFEAIAIEEERVGAETLVVQIMHL